MIFVMLAQINYNEAAGEIVHLNAQLDRLTEQQRRLEITFESVIDMKEVERYARDERGMSKPEADQVAVIHNVPADRVEILDGSDEGALQGLGSFVSSLLDNFR